MLALYNNAYSTCSQKVRLLLAEKGLDWEDRQIVFAKNEHLSDEYLRLNPNGVVPTLVHDGQVVIDSSVIMEYLDEVFPQPPMAPPGALGRAHVRQWLRYFEEVATPAVRPPSFNQAFLPRFQAMSAETFAAGAARRPLRRRFIERMGREGFPERDIAVAYEAIAQTCERMDAALMHRPWLADTPGPSIADCCVAPLLDRMDDLGHAVLWRTRPRVIDWLARWRARPSWAVTFYAGTRLSSLHGDLGRRALPAADLVAC